MPLYDSGKMGPVDRITNRCSTQRAPIEIGITTPGRPVPPIRQGTGTICRQWQGKADIHTSGPRTDRPPPNGAPLTSPYCPSPQPFVCGTRSLRCAS
jgi:hypothetical protein